MVADCPEGHVRQVGAKRPGRRREQITRSALPVLIAAAVSTAGQIAPDLQQIMDAAALNELVPVFVLAQGSLDDSWLAEATAGMTRTGRQEFTVAALKEMAATSQSGIIQAISDWPEWTHADLERHWLANAIYLEAAPELIRALSSLDAVMLVEGASDPEAGLVEPVETRSPSPEDLDRGIVWGVAKINADDVWAMGYDGSGVICGVIDSGTDYNHLDLAGNMWHDTPAGLHFGWDFFDGDNDPMDDNGHGTHVSGTLCGDGSGGTQTGVAPGATCMSLRINYWSGGENTWIEAMEFGVDHGADVLTMSLSTYQGNTTLRFAEQNLLAAGVFHAVAAGNDGPDPGTIGSSGDSPPPWFHPDQEFHGGQAAVATCGATDPLDGVPDFSSRGPVTWWTDYTTATPLIDPDLVAPGVDILSTWLGGGYMLDSGTSMATPHVAGVACLMLQANPELTVAQIDQILETTAIPLGPEGKDDTYGSGRIDALAAVQAAVELLGTGGGGPPAGAGALSLSAVSPNPACQVATFEVYTATGGCCDISVYDLAGRRVAGIDSGEITSGIHAYCWPVPAGMGNGIYFVRCMVEDASATVRMTVLR
jgi:subtilisin family serine protease